MVDQLQQPGGVLANPAQGILLCPVASFLQHALQRPQDQGERGAELVGDIGKEARFGLIRLAQFLRLRPDLLVLRPDLPGALLDLRFQLGSAVLQVTHPAFHDQHHRPGGQQGITYVGPVSAVPRGQDGQAQPAFFAELAVNIFRLHPEGEFSRRQAGVLLAAVAGPIQPIIIIAFQHHLEAVFRQGIEAGGGVVDPQGILAVGQQQL